MSEKTVKDADPAVAQLVLVVLPMNTTCSQCRNPMSSALCPICGWEDGEVIRDFDDDGSEEVSHAERTAMLHAKATPKRFACIEDTSFATSYTARAFRPRLWAGAR
jgi:hypothetical protein